MPTKPHPYLAHDQFMAFAHRGGSLEGAENTMGAFEAAIDIGYRHIETDCVATRDQVLLCFHDETLDRMTDRPGRIDEMTYQDIKPAKVGDKERIPLMEEVLGTWPEVSFNIEPKNDGAVDELITAIRKTNALDRVCVGSFATHRIERLRAALGPGLCTSMGPGEVARLYFSGWGFPSGHLTARCAQIPISERGIRLATTRMIRAAEKKGLKVHIWTVDDRETMEQLIDLGVHGIMTDRPSLLKQVLEERNLWI